MAKQFDCVKCKGRMHCGKASCMILDKFRREKSITSKVKGNSFVGSSPPGVFVSWKNYPKVSFAPLSPPSIEADADLLDNPERWFGLPQSSILSFRESLIRSHKPFDVSIAAEPSYDLMEMQESVMALKPVEVSIKLSRSLSPKLEFSQFFAPVGPSAPIKQFSLEQNPRIPKKVDKVVSDTNLKSLTAMNELFSSSIPVHSISKLLSAGLLGVKKNRKLVPTRWAITAADSQLSNSLLGDIRFFPEIDAVRLFESHYLDNHFFVLLFPGTWAFEQLEAWKPEGVWTPGLKQAHLISDHELFKPRKGYASNVAGAYYAARLAVCEYLKKEKSQAAALVFREIGSGYGLPLGVWQIRENMRNALKSSPLVFSSSALAFEFLEKKLSIPLKSYLKKSVLFDWLKNQKKLTHFL